MRCGPALCATSVKPTGTSMPPPMPCRTRKAISSPADVAERAERRADGEQRDRGDPGPLGAEALGYPARERDHRRQRQQVAGRDPLDGAQWSVQVPREGVERDVDDRRVEDRHDQPEGGHAGDHDRRPVEPAGQALDSGVGRRVVRHDVQTPLMTSKQDTSNMIPSSRLRVVGLGERPGTTTCAVRDAVGGVGQPRSWR